MKHSAKAISFAMALTVTSAMVPASAQIQPASPPAQQQTQTQQQQTSHPKDKSTAAGAAVGAMTTGTPPRARSSELGIPVASREGPTGSSSNTPKERGRAITPHSAPDHLTVLTVLDLDPRRRFRRVPGAHLLGDNPLHVPAANYAEQVRAVRDVLHIPNRVRQSRKQLPKERLPLREGPFQQVAPVQPEQIERIKQNGPTQSGIEWQTIFTPTVCSGSSPCGCMRIAKGLPCHPRKQSASGIVDWSQGACVRQAHWERKGCT
jgi:hypothetical protein